MEFVAQQIASIIQNISQSREDKAIKFVDVRNAMKAAFLTVYPGTSMYEQMGDLNLVIALKYRFST